VHRGTVGVIAAVAVGAILLLAGTTKVARPAAWRAEAEGMGVRGIVAAVVPWFELVLGAALVAQVQRRWLGWSAAVVFVAFTALIAVRLGQGRRPPCACFGSLSPKPLGAAHLARNAAFIALAVVAALA
jgi:uncharacterized membrane protein YphA (DoxX/SURF4 family)